MTLKMLLMEVAMQWQIKLMVNGDSTRPQAKDVNLVKNKRLKETDTGRHLDVIVIN